MKGKVSFSFRTHNLLPSFKGLVCYTVLLSSVSDGVIMELLSSRSQWAYVWIFSESGFLSLTVTTMTGSRVSHTMVWILDLPLFSYMALGKILLTSI